MVVQLMVNYTHGVKKEPVVNWIGIGQSRMDPNQQDMSTITKAALFIVYLHKNSPFVCNISPTVKSTRINTHHGLTSSLNKGVWSNPGTAINITFAPGETGEAFEKRRFGIRLRRLCHRCRSSSSDGSLIETMSLRVFRYSQISQFGGNSLMSLAAANLRNEGEWKQIC